MTEHRQNAIRVLDKASFKGEHGTSDIAILKLTIYELAAAHRVLSLVALDEDLEELNIEERDDLLEKPERPGDGAGANFLALYKLDFALWKEQSDGLEAVKTALVRSLDGPAKKVVSDNILGTLRRTIQEILELLMAKYHDISNSELADFKLKWQETRWNQSEDLDSFLSNFNDEVTFLDTHDYGATQGEQCIALLKAISHVPALADKTKAAFYAAAPNRADQTLELLCTEMLTIYRTQYSKTTAEEYHTSNQVTEAHADGNEIIVTGIAASARATLRGETVSSAQLETIQSAVTKAIRTCLHPRTAAAAPNTRRRNQNPDRGQRQTQTQLQQGECPLHRGAFHPWSQCFSNPAKETTKK